MSPGTEMAEFYSNDIVYRFDKRKKINFGIVVESYYETSSDSEDVHALQKGQLRVWWFNSSRETVWRQSKVHLMSRSVIPGDVVRRLEQGKEAQRGYCKESKQYACVQIMGTDKVIERVCSERLLMASPFDVNVAVSLGTKFGRIQSVDQKICMQSKCGSIVEVFTCLNSDVIDDYWLTKRDRSYVDNFYPGQEVTCAPNNLEQPRWLNRSKSMKRKMHTHQHFTVQKVEPSEIEVLWYDSASNLNNAAGAKSEELKHANRSVIKAEDIKNLKVLEPIENLHLELAERRLLKLNSSDVLMKKQDWLRKQSALRQPHDSHKVVHIVNRNAKKDRASKIHRPSLLSACVNVTESEEGWWTEDGEEVSDNGSSSSTSSAPASHIRHFPPKARELTPGHTLAVEVLCLDSKITVVWQDGSEEKNVPTTQLYYSISFDDHEFFPGEWVVRAAEDQNDKEYGVVQSVNHLERTAMVKWFVYSENEKSAKCVATNEKSVYDLRKHAKFSFRPGSVVKHVPEVADKLGTVIDSCPGGYVMVQWLDGSKDNVSPQNLEFLPDAIDYEYSMDDDESVQVSWETESIESIPGDLTDESTLQNMATRLDFIRSRVSFVKDILKKENTPDSFLLLKELLTIYDNSSYLDKLLDTSFFSLKSKHFQVLLSQIKENAKLNGVELRGRLFLSTDNTSLSGSSSRIKNPEKENVNKALKLEQSLINAEAEEQLRRSKAAISNGVEESSQPSTPDADGPPTRTDSICIELVSMMKVRIDLAYAEIISRIGGNQALSVMTKATDHQLQHATPLPSIPITPDESSHPPTLNPITFPAPDDTGPAPATTAASSDAYALLDEVHPTHHFIGNKVEPIDRMRFTKAVQKEYKLLRESLPPGVWVRAYADRLDLLSVMIRGPQKTPYEDGLFLFDIQISGDYPRSPPLCHFISYSSERLNPNLYVEGRVCVSLLGTWMGRGTEMWSANSTLLQLIVSIQGLILVAEPYFNEAGYEKQAQSQQGCENSRTYNELVVLKLVQSMTEMLRAPPAVFRAEILSHFAARKEAFCKRIEQWCGDEEVEGMKVEFPLVPISRGLKLSLGAALGAFREALKSASEVKAEE